MPADETAYYIGWSYPPRPATPFANASVQHGWGGEFHTLLHIDLPLNSMASDHERELWAACFAHLNDGPIDEKILDAWMARPGRGLRVTEAELRKHLTTGVQETLL